MYEIKEQIAVPFSTEQMYALVNHIEAYPEFIPACTAARIISRQASVLEAELVLRKSAFSYTLCTRNRLFPCHRIELELLSGPFTALHGAWFFTEIAAQTEGNNQSIVRLDLAFQLKNVMLHYALGKIFHQVNKELMQCFYQRAYQIYGLKS